MAKKNSKDYKGKDDLLLKYLETPLLQTLSTPQVLEANHRGQIQVRQYRANAIIHMDGDTCRGAELLLEGQLSISRIDSDGNHLIITQMTTGKLIGANLVFSATSIYPMTLTAIRDVTLLWISPEAILSFMQHSEAFLKCFLKDMSDNALIIGNKLKFYAQRPLKERLLNYLHAEASRQKSATLLLPITKTELAQRLGAQRTSISRMLQKLSDEGLVTYSGKTITLHTFEV